MSAVCGPRVRSVASVQRRALGLRGLDRLPQAHIPQDAGLAGDSRARPHEIDNQVPPAGLGDVHAQPKEQQSAPRDGDGRRALRLQHRAHQRGRRHADARRDGRPVPGQPRPAARLLPLFHISEATLLANLLKRSALSLIPTTGNVLTSINPCKPVEGLYSTSTMRQYAGRRPPRAPHLYAVAEGVPQLPPGNGQAIVVSGVSGAGKTEANKHIMQYLCWRAGQQATTPRLDLAQDLERALDVQLSEPGHALQSSVVFEAFCNACTTNNHNSSRFGKFTRLIEPNGRSAAPLSTRTSRSRGSSRRTRASAAPCLPAARRRAAVRRAARRRPGRRCPRTR